MTDPKSVELTALIRNGMSATFGLSDQAEMIADGLADAGWVSPDEAKAREAAARREALLEAADDMETAEAEDMRHVGCDPKIAWKGWSDGSLISLMEGAMLWAPWLRDRAAALAEPARDEVTIGVSCPCGRQFKTRKGYNTHRGARGNCPDTEGRR